MQNRLKEYFPMIRERSEVLAGIYENRQLLTVFNGWQTEQQEEFLDFCTGVRGVKLLYDSFFKEIMNPEYDAGRLENFLSGLLKQQVKIVKVLPNDSVRIAAEHSLLITDLVVELEDGSLANIEIQKIGYLFPGERASCYSADLLLRQYKRVRDERKKKFRYQDIKPVYTIVLFEQSPKEFQQFQDIYLHYIEPKSDSGISLNLLQKFLFVPLDIFRKIYHNKRVTDRVDAWLAFLCMDEPEDIIRLITDYPEFKPMYEEMYRLCMDTEKIMGLFSKELEILDENTVQYMMDVMQDEINDHKAAIEEMNNIMEERQNTINEQNETINYQQSKINYQQSKINDQQSKIDAQQKQLTEKESVIQALQKRIEELERK